MKIKISQYIYIFLGQYISIIRKKNRDKNKGRHLIYYLYKITIRIDDDKVLSMHQHDLNAVYETVRNTFARCNFNKQESENRDCVISNNAAENAIRPFTVGRKTGCSVTLQGVPKQAQRSIALWRQQRQTDLMFSNTLNCC